MSDFDEQDNQAEIETTEVDQAEGAVAEPVIEVVATSRVFKVGGTTIHEDASTAELSNEAARDVLKIMYPEIANSTIRETVNGSVRTVEFLPQPGRKG